MVKFTLIPLFLIAAFSQIIQAGFLAGLFGNGKKPAKHYIPRSERVYTEHSPDEGVFGIHSRPGGSVFGRYYDRRDYPSKNEHITIRHTGGDYVREYRDHPSRNEHLTVRNSGGIDDDRRVIRREYRDHPSRNGRVTVRHSGGIDDDRRVIRRKHRKHPSRNEHITVRHSGGSNNGRVIRRDYRNHPSANEHITVRRTGSNASVQRQPSKETTTTTTTTRVIEAPPKSRVFEVNANGKITGSSSIVTSSIVSGLSNSDLVDALKS